MFATGGVGRWGETTLWMTAAATIFVGVVWKAATLRKRDAEIESAVKMKKRQKAKFAEDFLNCLLQTAAIFAAGLFALLPGALVKRAFRTANGKKKNPTESDKRRETEGEKRQENEERDDGKKESIGIQQTITLTLLYVLFLVPTAIAALGVWNCVVKFSLTGAAAGAVAAAGTLVTAAYAEFMHAHYEAAFVISDKR